MTERSNTSERSSRSSSSKNSSISSSDSVISLGSIREPKEIIEHVTTREISTQTEDVDIEPSLPAMYTPPKTGPKHLWKSIYLNWMFYISLIGCCYYISINTHYSFKQAILTIIFISMLGYFVHMGGHYTHLTQIYKANNNYITNNSVLDYIVTKLCHFADFHDTTHHDSDINKQPLNVIYEFINNFVLQGGLVAYLASSASNYCFPAIILWALMYATVHNINYILMPPKTHQNHHMNKHSSYGLDIWDVIFNTKQDPDEIEVYNHMSINMILLTLGIVYYYKHYC